ncbi:MAG: methyl-accepting chemotaxis sensory transducer [Paenibacillus sp.]|nr:methyl-accepting chemotaxis sensory transducer [Paenibacillus sp.]
MQRTPFVKKEFWKGKPRGVTMRFKLAAGFAAIVLALTGTVGFQTYMQAEIERQIALQNAETEKQLLAMKMKQEVLELASLHAGLVVTRQEDHAVSYEQIEKSFAEHVKQIADTASSPEERKWSATLVTVSGEFTSTFHAALDTLRSAPASEAGRLLDQQFSLSQVHKEYIFEQADLFNRKYTESAAASMQRSEQLSKQVKAIALYVSAAAVMLALLVSLYIIRSFQKPIHKMKQAMGLIGEGDLRHRIGSSAHDELGQLSRGFDKMMDNVSTMLVRMREIGVELNGRSSGFSRFAQTTSSVSSDVLEAIGEIAQGADQQASLVERSAQLVSELGSQIEAISRSADEMKRLSGQTGEYADQGAAKVSELQDAAETADRLLRQADLAVETFVADTAHITKIVQAITEIASQTNVLSLNASIEAARAGQHGKGFLVIADEVRQLAEQTKTSAQSIAGIVGSLQQQMAEVRSQMAAAGAASRAQSGKVGDTLESFRTIQQSIAGLSGQTELIHAMVVRGEEASVSLIGTIQHVAAIAEETAAGVQEVNSASTEQNESVRQVAEQAGAMHELAAGLFGEIGKFRTPYDTELTARRDGP